MTDGRGTNTKFNFNDDVKVLRRIIENSGTNHFLGGTRRGRRGALASRNLANRGARAAGMGGGRAV
jgi:hypothetical protein